MDDAGSTRRVRLDKERNRTHILAVAERFFAERGVAGSMDAIAKQAGVGPGTLYRHFSNRDDLLAALLRARYEELASHAETIRREETDPGIALERWLAALSGYVTAFEGLPEPLRVALSEKESPLAMTCDYFISTTDDFLAAAQRAGGARTWVRGRDLFLTVLATAWVRGAALADESSAEALHTILRSGWKTSTTDRTAPEA